MEIVKATYREMTNKSRKKSGDDNKRESNNNEHVRCVSTSSACFLLSITHPGNAFHTALWGMVSWFTVKKQAAVSHAL